MQIRAFRPTDERSVTELWRGCGLVRPWNDPQRNIQRKLGGQPEHQRLSIGQSMMAHAEALLLARGCPKITLMVRSGNKGVIAFYRQLGYTEDAVVVLGKRLIADL